jgi:ribosomal protein S18 acetylase RimI-like enzyme
MSVRRALVSDREKLNYLLKELHRERPTYFNDVEDSKELLDDQKTRVFVIGDNENLYGFSVIQEERDEVILSMVYVLPEMRGRGYGYALTKAAIDSEKNIKAYVKPSNIPMKKILEKLGFSCLDEGDEDYGRWMAVYKLEKKVKE